MEQGTAVDTAVALTRKLRQTVSETRSDIDGMPIFVRPMAKKGFAKRTGKSFDEWESFADDLGARLQRDPGTIAHKDAIAALERLLDNYRTAPERAGRFMRDAALLDVIRERSLARERVVTELMDALRVLRDG